MFCNTQASEPLSLVRRFIIICTITLSIVSRTLKTEIADADHTKYSVTYIEVRLGFETQITSCIRTEIQII